MMNAKDHSTKNIISLDSFQIGMLVSVALISESGILNSNNDWFLIFQRLIMSGMAMFLLVRVNLFISSDFVYGINFCSFENGSFLDETLWNLFVG